MEEDIRGRLTQDAEAYFRQAKIPEEDIPDLLEEFAEGKPSKSRYQQLARSAWIARVKDSAPADAERCFRAAGVPEDEIPALLAEFAKGTPSERRYQDLARKSCNVRLEKSAAAVAEEWFRLRGVPEDKILALLAEYAKGPPSTARYESIAGAHFAEDAERIDAEWREAENNRRRIEGEEPLPAPVGAPTIAEFAARLREIQQDWATWSHEEGDRRLAAWYLDILWTTARQIPDMPPPPPLGIPVREPVRDMQQALEKLDALLTWCEPTPAETPAVPASTPSPAPQPTTPQEILATWREILIALGMGDNNEDREKVRRLNDTRSGPIQPGGRGEQPIVGKTALLAWWDGLLIRHETENRARDAKATVAPEHRHQHDAEEPGFDYGRDGRVVPEVSGDVQKRRADRKP